MKQSASRFAGLLLLAALLVSAPLLSAKDRKEKDKACDKDWDDRASCSVSVPDSHGESLLLLTGGLLGSAVLFQWRRKITS